MSNADAGPRVIEAAMRKHAEAQRDQAQAQRRDLVSLLVDLAHPALRPVDVQTFGRLHALRMSYLHQGRAREAHGVAQATRLLWHCLVHPRNAAPDSTLGVTTRPADL